MTSTSIIQVPWLPKPVWQDFPLAKGLNHHRKPVGIILAADEEITCVLESETLSKVQMRLVNNGSKSEGELLVTDTNADKTGTLAISSVSVPFVDCEYLDDTPTESRTISVSYPSDSKALPIYHFGDNEEAFFELWDSQEAEFAYIESDYFGLLIPEIDKEATRSLPDDKHLDDIILFYDEILTIYSHLIGLSFESSGTNQNIRNRFFIKADKNGSGAAYYCDWCTAETSESVKAFWLNISPSNWGALHEIGHGHELHCLTDETLSVKEVWNNLLVVFYQNIMFGNDMATKCPKIDEMRIFSVLGGNLPVKEWGLFHKLSFLVHMFLKAGQNSFTRFNQLIRQELSGRQHYACGTTLVEKLMHFFAIEFGIDVYPFMRLAKATVSDEQILEHYYSFPEVAYPLVYLINSEEELNAIQNRLGLWYKTSLVTPLDLRPTKLKNDFTLKFDDHLFDDLFGDLFKLMDGPRTVTEKRITQQTIILRDVPIGVYKVFISPNSFNSQLVYSDFYAVVHSSTPSQLVLSAKPMTSPSVLHDAIKFHGLGDEHFATLSVNPLKRIVSFHVFSDIPHSYFKNETYASVNIKNKDNEVIFNKKVQGKHCAMGLYTVFLEEPLQIEVFHAETRNRLKVTDTTMDSIIDYNSNTNYLIVNELGFQTKDTPKEMLQTRFLNRIELIVSKIRNNISLYERPCCHPKYNLLLAIETFEYLFNESCVNSDLRESYKDCFPPELSIQLAEALVNFSRKPAKKISRKKYHCTLIHSKTGQKLTLPNDNSAVSLSTITFLGISDGQVAKLFVDTQNCTIQFQVLSSEPHYRFEGETYIEVTIRNKENEEIFQKTLQGTDATEEEFSIPFDELTEIDVFHAEPFRLQPDLPAVSEIIDKNSNLNTLILTKEFSHVKYNYVIRQTSTGEKISLPNDVSAIPFSKLKFLGLNGKLAAILYVDVHKSIIHFSIVSADPHWRFENEPYFRVTMRNSKKEVLFDKLVEGLHPEIEEFDIHFVQRVELEVFHAEPTRLVSDNLMMRDIIDRKSNTNNFSISREISIEHFIYELKKADSDIKVQLPTNAASTPCTLIKFLGLDDNHVASLLLDPRNDRIQFNVLTAEPNSSFEDEIYISVIIRNALNEEIFSKEISGVDDLQENFTVPLTGNIEIDIIHVEPERLVSDDPEIERLIDHESKINTFIFKKTMKFSRKSKKIKHLVKRCFKTLKRSQSF